MRDGDRYVVNGQKVWISRAEYSDLMLLIARTTPREEVVKKTDGLSVFLVRAGVKARATSAPKRLAGSAFRPIPPLHESAPQSFASQRSAAQTPVTA